jgi:hypothetical protein
VTLIRKLRVKDLLIRLLILMRSVMVTPRGKHLATRKAIPTRFPLVVLMVIDSRLGILKPRVTG